MTQHIRLRGTIFFIAGRFSSGTQHDIANLIESHGGKTTRVFRTSVVTCVVAGERCVEYKNKARSRDIPIIDHAQLMQLLEQGSIELPDEEFIATEFDMAQAIAELRSIFDGPPSSLTWTRCVEIIEQCDPAHEAQLVAYIAPFLARWDSLDMDTWQPPKAHAMMSGMNAKYWGAALRDPELRVAPPIWTLEMLRGEYSPKHSLARLVNVHYAKTNGGRLVKLWHNPHLTHVNTLVLGNQNNYSKAFFEALRTSPNSRAITTLYLDIYDEHARAHFLEVMARPEHELTSLERLFVHTNNYYLKTTSVIRALPPFAKATIAFGEWSQGARRWKTLPYK